MRYAIVSDVHANWQAWCAVRDDIKARGVDAMVCLGDIVGYGPSPSRVVSDMRAHCDNFVLGNHDAAAAGKLDLSLFNENARRSAEWTAGQFDRASLKMLGDTPLLLEDEDIVFAHAETPAPDDFGYVEEPDDARACFSATEKRFIFIGHTHRPTIFVLSADGRIEEKPAGEYIADVSERCLVNVGSVGDPGDGTDKASYCIFDSELGIIELCKVAFDTDAFFHEIQRVPELGTPWFLQHREGERFRPAHDQTVPTGKVSGSQIRVTASRARIRVRSGALTAAPDKVMDRFRPAPRKKNSRKAAVAATAAIVGAALVACFLIWKSPHARSASPQVLSPVTGAAPDLPAAKRVELPLVLAASAEELIKTNLTGCAMDGDMTTRWCAGDGMPGHWLQIDLGVPASLGGMEIFWEIPDKPYGATIDCGDDEKRWKLAASCTATGGQRIAFATTSRFIRINVTRLPPQKWASICEVKLFDDKGGEIRRPATVRAKPEIAEPRAITLLAKDAKLHGKEMKIETRYDNIPNIGYWSAKTDFVDWPLTANRSGVYEVELCYALEVSRSGNEIEITAGKERLKAVIRATAAWAKFETVKAGRIRIAAGGSTLAVKVSKLNGGGLMNLRSLTLRRVAD